MVSPDGIADRGPNLWEVTTAAMTTINFCSKFIVQGEGVSFGTPVVANVAGRSGKNGNPTDRRLQVTGAALGLSKSFVT
jgi:hypothetical protein